MNAHHATLTGLATAHTGSTVEDSAPNPPVAGSFDLILQAAAGSALGNSGTPYTLTISAFDLTAVTQGWPTLTRHQAFDAANGWEFSGTGPDYQYTQTVAVPVPGGAPGGPLAGHTLQWRPDRVHHPQPSIRTRLILGARPPQGSGPALAVHPGSRGNIRPARI